MHHMPNSYAKHPVFTLMSRALVQTIYRALLTSAVSGIGHHMQHGMSHHSTHTSFKVALNKVYLHGSAYCCKGNNSLDISGGQWCGMNVALLYVFQLFLCTIIKTTTGSQFAQGLLAEQDSTKFHGVIAVCAFNARPCMSTYAFDT